MPFMAGTKVYIQVFEDFWDYQYRPLSFDLNINRISGYAFPNVPFARIQSPINDLFQDAIPISGGTQILGYDSYATLQGGEARVSGRSKSIWYKFTPNRSGRSVVSITSFDGGNAPDTNAASVGFWQGTSLNNITLLGGGNIRESQVTIPWNGIQAGQTYYISLNGSGVNTGDASYLLSITNPTGPTTPPPAAQNLDLQGTSNWRRSGNNLIINTGRILNNRSSRTRTLRIGVWATAQPYRGGALQGRVMGYRNLPALQARSSYSARSHTVPYRTLPSGTYYTTVALIEFTGSAWVVRDFRNVPGVTRIGNGRPPQPRRPDLVVTGIRLSPPRLMRGQLIRAKVTVKNRGTARSAGGIVEVWRHKTSEATASERGNGRLLIGALNPGQSRTLTFTLKENVRAPNSNGNYVFRAKADNYGVVTESNESNNERAISYQVVNLNRAANNQLYKLSAAKTGVRYYEFFVPRGTRRVHFLTRPAINPRPGSGNPNLYVKRGAGAYPGDFHRASLNPGAFERITIPNPAPGTYFVTVYGQDAYQDILLRMWRE
jgi:hypothetical protein